MNAARTDAVIGEAGKVVAQVPTRDLVIGFDRGDVRYEGTAAQLQDEGLIPDDLEWPLGCINRHWCAKGFRYLLARMQPAGHKGTLKSWSEVDNWVLLVQPEQWARSWRSTRDVAMSTIELVREIHRQMPEGQLAAQKFWGRLEKAREDEAYQAFKAAFVPKHKKPSRASKSKAVQP